MGNNSYYLYQKYVKYGSQDWIPVYPVEYAISGDTGQNPVIKSSADTNCGYCPPEYRWKAAPIGEEYICSGGNKYFIEYYQVSNDCGFSWENVEPESARTGNLYESGSSDCDFSKNYLTFIPTSGSSTFTYYAPYSASTSANTLYYSLDSGSTWSSMTSGQTVTVNQGNKIYWKATGLERIGSFSSNNYFDVEGNIMSLVSGDSFENATTITNDYQFAYLFYVGRNKVVNAENLILPATALTKSCYEGMFEDCTSLITAPSLPATTLAESCYYGMFQSCWKLTVAPELPATTLEEKCYMNMFMASKITTAPVLSATTLADYCYYQMFANCTSLTAITCLATDISANYCLSLWVYGVQTISGTFTKTSSMSSWTSGVNGIPNNWTVQNYS